MKPVLVLIAIVLAIVALGMWFAPDALSAEHNRMALVYSICLLVVIGGGIVAGFRNDISGAIKSALIWMVILLVLVGGYALRDDFAALGRDMLAAIAPGTVVSEGTSGVSLRRGRDGHFHLRAQVEGETVSFIVDTGASLVVLSARDAERIGIDWQNLEFSMPVNTANGTTTAAPLRLGEISAGNIVMRDVEAAVMRPEALAGSLLGLTFLSRLSSYSFEGDTLILRR